MSYLSSIVNASTTVCRKGSETVEKAGVDVVIVKYPNAGLRDYPILP